jgi:hypothetical protein
LFFCLIFVVIWNRVPNKLDFRIYMCSWLLFCLVMSTAYSALLSSSMSVPFLTPTIKTFSELAKAHSEGRIKIIAHTNSLYYQMIKVCICSIHNMLIQKFLKRIFCIYRIQFKNFFQLFFLTSSLVGWMWILPTDQRFDRRNNYFIFIKISRFETESIRMGLH